MVEKMLPAVHLVWIKMSLKTLLALSSEFYLVDNIISDVSDEHFNYIF